MAIKTASKYTPGEEETYLNLADAATFCGGVSVATIRAAILKKELRRFKAGRGKNSRTLVALSDLRKFVRQA